MQKHSKLSPVRMTTVRVVLGAAAVTFLSSAVLLGVLSSLGVALADAAAVFMIAALLTLAIVPSVHWLVYAPAPQTQYDEPPADMNADTVTDPLTHILNRRGITMGVLEAMAQAERYNTKLSLAMVDVDRFKRVNEEFGEKSGDKVLTDLAAVLADSLRMPDKVGRYGGEEFMVVLPHTGLTAARKIAERIRANVANAKLSVNGKRTPLTVSIGVTHYVKGADLERLLSCANAAVEEAKRDNGNRVVAQKGR
ncbi:MAG TPA: GGDEF domain-containing protein [Burkholderiales bacterium]|nr:GGDEF domain-containing protein [Burkholderiales bacterium]